MTLVPNARGRYFVIHALAIAAVVLAGAGCEPAPAPTIDAAPVDGGGTTTDGGPRDPSGLYAECSGAAACGGTAQECLQIVGPAREAGQCTFFCAHDAECPDGACVRSTSSTDPRYRCVRVCAEDTDCAAGFQCFGVFLMTIDGVMTSDVCYPG